MNQPPHSRKERILTRNVYFRSFGFLGLITAVLSMGLFWVYLKAHGWNGGALLLNDPLYLQATTLTFSAIVFAQIANGLSCRSTKDSLWKIGVWSNRYYVAGVGVQLGVLFTLIFFIPLASIFGTAMFDPIYWWAVVAVMVIVLAAEEVRKGWNRGYSHTKIHIVA